MMIRTLPSLASTVLLAASAFAQSSFVVPAAQATSLGNTAGGFPFSYTAYVRLQQAIGTSHFPSPGFLHGVAFRSKPGPLNLPEVQNQGMRVDLSDCATAVNALSTTYANNTGTNVKTVFNGTFNIQRPNPADPLEFSTLIPFDAPYLHVNAAPLLVDLIATSFMGQQCAGGGNGTSFDGVTDPNIATVFGKSGNPCPSVPTTGSPGNVGFVMKFFSSSGLFPFGKSCGGATVPAISSSGAPTPGSTNFQVHMANAPVGTPSLAALLIGASDATWGPFPLPWELVPLGMPSCFLTVSIDASVSTGVGGGAAIMPLPIPNNLTLLGQRFYAQWFSVANGVNAFGGVTTQGGAITIR